MERFEEIMTRHGETGVQALLENWERFAGITYKKPLPLETRWAFFIRYTMTVETLKAA
ncbi:MAG: hypothetical protein RBT70_08285 [Alphaproteobacteria bacterium]|jgi:hypothetical protein|nr:hypothetical protein [Alphaproteobacteria bacterium]